MVSTVHRVISNWVLVFTMALLIIAVLMDIAWTHGVTLRIGGGGEISANFEMMFPK
jgi:hypothetical protein